MKMNVTQAMKMIERLDNLVLAMNEIYCQWDASDSVSEVMNRVKGFPFESSFDELTQQVSDWAYRVEQELKMEVLISSILSSIDDAQEVLNSTTGGNTTVDSEDIKDAMQYAWDKLME